MIYLKHMIAMLVAAFVSGFVVMELSTIWRNPDLSFWEGTAIGWIGESLLHLLIIVIALMAMLLSGHLLSRKAHVVYGGIIGLMFIVLMAMATGDILLLSPYELACAAVFGIFATVMWFLFKRIFDLLPRERRP